VRGLQGAHDSIDTGLQAINAAFEELRGLLDETDPQAVNEKMEEVRALICEATRELKANPDAAGLWRLTNTLRETNRALRGC
jgi:hypothetical protein